MSKKIAAIIVAAGLSRRMSSVCQDKLMLKIRDTEVLARTMIQYQRAQTVSDIYVVTRKELFDTVKGFAKTYGIDKFKGVCCGGETRQQSVTNGLALCEDADFVAIADGARPFVKPMDIDRVSLAAAQHGGAVLCVAVKDTVKVVGEDGFIVSTPPRETLLLAQTPQTFRKDRLCKLMQQANAQGKTVTDDSSVFEMFDEKVFAVIGDYDNIKITTEEDILQAETIAGKDSV